MVARSSFPSYPKCATIPQSPCSSYVDICWSEIASHCKKYTVLLFNIAMENGPFIVGLPIKNGDFPWRMLNNQMVYLTYPTISSSSSPLWHPRIVRHGPTSEWSNFSTIFERCLNTASPEATTSELWDRMLGSSELGWVHHHTINTMSERRGCRSKHHSWAKNKC